jgi:acetoin utilization deacetylase AcuC-like enzyme
MSDRRPLLVRDARFRQHASADDHPERPARLDAVDRALAGLAGQFDELEPRASSDEELLRVHSPRHLEALESVEGRVGQLDADTYVSERSVEVARLAAGGTIEAALRVARGDARIAFALVRPPGHHAESRRAMGFCLLNNVAIASAALRAQAGIQRVAIVDWDLHHGNGTQHIFDTERDVLYLSLHQYPFYPGTGALSEQGSDGGQGSTVNLPLPRGAGDPEMALAFEGLVAPVIREFRPDFLMVSAGFDAHRRDPLGGLQVTTEGFVRMAAVLREVAEDCCDGRMLLVLEGGYDLEALGSSVRGVLEVLGAAENSLAARPPTTDLGDQLLSLYKEAHSSHWRSLSERVV